MVQLFKRSVMKEDLICGVAILLYLVLLYLLTTAFIKTGRAVDRYKMKKNEDNENKAREMLKEAIIELSKKSKIDCDGL